MMRGHQRSEWCGVVCEENDLSEQCDVKVQYTGEIIYPQGDMQ